MGLKNLVRISRVKEHPEIPFEPRTLYYWVHKNKHPEIFVKLGGAVFVDLEKLEDLVERSRLSQVNSESDNSLLCADAR